jgi:hypothetical protein
MTGANFDFDESDEIGSGSHHQRGLHSFSYSPKREN